MDFRKSYRGFRKSPITAGIAACYGFPECAAPARNPRTLKRRIIMGKYFLAWLLGVPAFVLVLIYLIF
jgi:hypothetical protein